MRRSTVRSLPLQSVFPGDTLTKSLFDWRIQPNVYRERRLCTLPDSIIARTNGKKPLHALHSPVRCGQVGVGSILYQAMFVKRVCKK